MKSGTNFLNNTAIKYRGIPISRVINTDYLESLKDIYKCNICFKIMINPNDCGKCGHSYCFDCINDSNCPFNCENYSIRPSSIGIKLILNNLLFRCENEGCTDSIPYNSVPNHDSQCEYRLIKCPNLNCGINLAKRNLQNHIESICKYTNEKCKFCCFEFPRIEIKNHVDSCEAIFHSLNLSANEELNVAINNSHDSISNTSHIQNSSTLTARKDYSKIKAKSYLEALSLNLGKIVKENDQKYNALKEENSKIKNEYNNEVKDLLNKMNEKLEKLKTEEKIKNNQRRIINNKNYNLIDNEEDNSENDNEELIDNVKSSEEDINHARSDDEKNDQVISNKLDIEKDDESKDKFSSDAKIENEKSKAFLAMENIYSGDHTTKLDDVNLINADKENENINDDILNSKRDKENHKEKDINDKAFLNNSAAEIIKQSDQKKLNKNIFRNLLKSGQKKESKSVNVFKEYMKEILEKHINDNLINRINKNLKTYIDEQEDKIKEVFISQNIKESIRFNEDIVNIIRQIVKLSEDNIKSFLKDVKSYIIEEFKEQIKSNSQKEVLNEIELKMDEIKENFTNFSLDTKEIKKKIEALLESDFLEKNKGDSNSNMNDKTYFNSEFNMKYLEENIDVLKIQTEEIEKYIKKIYEENIKELMLINDNVNQNIINEKDNYKTKELESIQNEIIKNIQEKIENKNNSITEFFEESIKDLKNLIKTNFEKSIEAINESNKLSAEKTTNVSIESKENDEINLDIDKLSSNFLKNVIETFDYKIDEVKSFVQEKIEKQTKEISLKLSNENIQTKNIEYKSKNDINLNENDNDLTNTNLSSSKNINEYENKLETLIKKFEVNMNEEFETLKTDINSFSKNNKEIKSIITEEFGEITDVLKDLKLTNDKLNFKEKTSEEENKIDLNNLDFLAIKQNLIDKDYLEELLNKKINLIYERIIQNINLENNNYKNSLEGIIIKNNNQIEENFEKTNLEISKLQENYINLASKLDKIDLINGKVDNFAENITDEINNMNQNTQKTIDFNQMKLIIKIEEKFDELKTENETKIETKSFDDQSNTYLNQALSFPQNSNLITEEILLKNNEDLKSKITCSFECSLKREFENLDAKIESKITEKLKDFYELKWCYQCEKIDYNFAFKLCLICNLDNCKDCIKLCKICKTLNCKKCVLCPKCSELSCINCRSDCFFCSKEKKEKFCGECLKNCFFCKKATCMECTRQCLNCSSLTCRECARLCRICLKCSCRRCETIKNFKSCFHCKQTACNECVVECKECKLEVCGNCFNSCKNCNKLLCKKCGIDCENCGDIFCDKCAKDLNQNDCYICRKLFCISCVKYLRKCKKCSGSACKNCCANCLKCKNVFCKNCNVNCDSCEDYACVVCVYKCACENLIFCEKCLFGISPISPELHNCVLWLNDSPNFSGIKSRSKISLPKNFEAKFYLEKFDSVNFLIGITDNSTFNEDTLSFIDNIWAFKPKTGQKYSSKKSLENYYSKEVREKDFIIIALKNENLYFRVNFDDNPPAYQLPPNKDYYLYIENDSMLPNLKVKYIYLRKI